MKLKQMMEHVICVRILVVVGFVVDRKQIGLRKWHRLEDAFMDTSEIECLLIN